MKKKEITLIYGNVRSVRFSMLSGGILHSFCKLLQRLIKEQKEIEEYMATVTETCNGNKELATNLANRMMEEEVELDTHILPAREFLQVYHSNPDMTAEQYMVLYSCLVKEENDELH